MTERNEPTQNLARLNAALGGRYRVDRQIGAGGMATVYAARDLRHDRDVAIKVLQPELALFVGADRFLAEIRTTARLHHPNILPLFDSGEANGLLFFVMPLVEGRTVRQRMEHESPLPLDTVLSIAADICGALEHAHRQSVIHRDIKPENILLQDGRALLADFGIALAAGPGDRRLTGTGMSLGTPAYMSPEQVLGERTVDARTDVYAVGTVVYEMLTGAPPFTGTTPQAIVARTLSETPAPPSRHRPGIPPAIDAAVLAALQKDPANRPPTAEALRVMLMSPEAPGAAPPPTPRRRRGVVWATVGVAAIVAAGLGLASWKRADAATPVVAIFPFTNITGDTSNTALGQGIPLAIFDALRPLHLDVIPIETSSELARHYASDDAAALGHRLRASAILVGKFELDGGRARIHTQLIDVGNGALLWSGQFNGSSNLFDLEDSVALAVANATRVTLSESQRAAYQTVPAVAPEVHRVVVRAMGYIERRDDASMRAGADLLQAALAMDSTYAPAWAALARAHALIRVYGDVPGDTDFRQAQSAVDHALRLNDNLAGAHLTRAMLHTFFDHDYRAAAVEFQRSLALDSGDASTRLFRSWYYLAVKQPDSAVTSIELARRLDPNSPVIRAREGTVLYYTGHLREAATALERALAADSANFFARQQLIEDYADLGQCGAALELIGDLPPASDQFENSDEWYARARCGDGASARAFTAQMESREAHHEYVDPYAIARVYAGLGDTTRMWPSLQRAVSTGMWELWALHSDPAFKAYRDDARFKALDEQAPAR